MKKKFLLFIFGVCLALPSMAYDFISDLGGNGVTWGYNYLTGSNVEITYVYTTDTDGNQIAAPYDLTAMGSYTTFPSMTINNDVMYSPIGIGESALENATGYSETLGYKTITLGSTYTYIGAKGFKNMSGVSTVDLSSSKITTIGDEAFYGCADMTTLSTPTTLTSLGASSFYGCSGLIEFVIPASVSSIGAEAFAYCTGLTTITCNATTPPTLGDDVFEGLDCNAITLIVPEGSEDDYKADSQWGKFYTETGSPFDDGDTFTVNGLVYNIVSADDLTVELGDNSSYSGAVNIPETVDYSGVTFTVIGLSDYAFSTGSYRSDITSVSMPNTVTYIGAHAFHSCNGITSMNLSTGLTRIGEHAFHNCYNWKESIEIPAGVTRIEASTFQYAAGLTSIKISENVTYIGNSGFYECNGVSEFIVPNSVTEIDQSGFQHCTGLESITLGSGLTSLGTQAIYNCEKLTSVTSLNPEPPTCGTNAFSASDIAAATLYVPCAGKDAYAEASVWSGFGTIETVDECGGGEPITFDYTVNPPAGEVTSLRTITISFADGVQLNAKETSKEDDILWSDAKLYKDNVAVAEVIIYSATGSNPVTAYQFTLGEDASAKTISDPGEYDFIMPAGYLSFYDTSSGTWVESEEISVHYVISESGGSSEHQYSVDPPEGGVTELSKITFFSPEGFVGHDYDQDYSGTISIYRDGVLYATTTNIESDWDSDITYDGDCYLYFTLESTITEAGDYQVVIPAGLFYWLNDGEPGSLNEAITLNYTIGGSTSGTFTYTVDPADGESVGQLDKITFYNDYGIYFNEDDENGYDEDPIVVYNSAKEEVAYIDDINYIEGSNGLEIGQEVTFSPVVTAVGDYTVVVPASFFYAYDENGNKSYNDEITLSYSIKETSQGTTGGVPEGYVLDPADGTEVPSLSEIVISLENDQILTQGSNFATIYVKDEADEDVATITVDDETDYGKVICTLDTKITTAGTYKITFPAGALWNASTYDPNPEFTVTYYVTGETGTGSNYVIVIDPESGTTHESLNEFSLTCTDGFSLNDFDNPLEVKKDEVVVAHAWYDTPIMDGVNYIGYNFTFSDTSDGPESLTLTEEGTYTIYVPKEYFILGDNVSEYNEEFTITYYLEGGEPTGTYGFTVDPPQGEVESLKEITFTSDEVDGFLGNYEYAEYTQKALVYDRFNRGDPITTATMSNLYNYPDNYDYGILLTLDEEITEPGSYSVVIPEGSFYWVVNDEPILNEEITLSYGVVEPQGEYTFVPADNSTLSSLSEFTVYYEDGIDPNYYGQVTVEDEYGEVVAYDEDCEPNYPDDWNEPTPSCTITLTTTITAKGTYTVTIPEGYFIVGSSYANSKELKITYYVDGSEEGTPLADGTEFNYDGLNYKVVSSEERTIEVVDNASYSGAADIPARFTYSNVTYTVIGIGESAFWDGSNYNGNLTSVVMPSTVTYIGDRGFYHCNKLTSVTLSENLESIGIEAFRGDSGIEGDLVIPDGVTAIENYTFQSCSHLSSITIGNGVTTIGQQAFFECTSATKLTVGSSVTEINTQAFGSCSALTSVTSLNPAPPECGSSVFSSVEVSSIPLYVPAGSKDLYQASGTWQDFYEIIELEGTPTTTTFECVVDPADGSKVAELYQNITFYNPTEGGAIYVNEYCDGVIEVYSEDETLVTKLAQFYTEFGPDGEDYSQTVFLEDRVSEEGTYYVEVPAETFYIVDASGNTLYSAAMKLTYIISSDAGDENPNENLTFAPTDGSEVEVLDAISIFCEDGITEVMMPEEEITITDSNNAVWTGTYTITEVEGDSGTITEVVITLNPSISDPGTYYVHVPAGYFQVGQQVNTEFTLTYYVTGVTTGISGFSINDDNVEGIYSTAGQKLNQTQRGVNIIRFSDGSVKKLYVK